MSETILITGASGQLGRIVLDQVLASGKVAPASVIAASRDPSKLAAYAEKGVQVRKVDFDDPAALPAAFAGADRILIVSTDALGEPGKRLVHLLRLRQAPSQQPGPVPWLPPARQVRLQRREIALASPPRP